MGRFVNPDNTTFKAALNTKIYVDKTELIEFTNSLIGTTENFICNSRPRRFGKSYTANMLSAYYSKGCDSQELFSSLAVAKNSAYREYLNKFDVIHFDLQWFFSKEHIDETVDLITKTIVDELKKIYEGVLSADIRTIPDALSQINAATGNRFVIIIDEWDMLIRDASKNKSIQDKYIDFLRRLFKGIEPEKYIALAYITGILPIKKYNTQSALNNFNEYTMLDPGSLAPYIGFTESEVKLLCDEYHKDFSEVKRWYDGYQLGEYHVYNPRAVVSLMTRGNFQSYWTQTGTYESILPLINMDFDGLRSDIIDMLSGDSVTVIPYFFQNDMVSFRDKDDVLTLLIHLGYLGYDQTRKQAFIPNEEIRFEFAMATKLNKWSELRNFEKESHNLLNAVLDGDEAAVADMLEKIHNQYISIIQYNDENALSYTIDLAYYAARDHYTVIRELPTGKGFADLAFIPKTDKPAILVELKWNQGVNTAITQIKEKKYPSVLEKYKGNLLLVGITYDKKTRKHICKIERL